MRTVTAGTDRTFRGTAQPDRYSSFYSFGTGHSTRRGGVQAARQVGFHSTQGGGGPAREYQYCCDWCPVESEATAEPKKIYENLWKSMKIYGNQTKSTKTYENLWTSIKSINMYGIYSFWKGKMGYILYSKRISAANICHPKKVICSNWENGNWCFRENIDFDMQNVCQSNIFDENVKWSHGHYGHFAQVGFI